MGQGKDDLLVENLVEMLEASETTFDWDVPLEQDREDRIAIEDTWQGCWFKNPLLNRRERRYQYEIAELWARVCLDGIEVSRVNRVRYPTGRPWEAEIAVPVMGRDTIEAGWSAPRSETVIDRWDRDVVDTDGSPIDKDRLLNLLDEYTELYTFDDEEVRLIRGVLPRRLRACLGPDHWIFERKKEKVVLESADGEERRPTTVRADLTPHTGGIEVRGERIVCLHEPLFRDGVTSVHVEVWHGLHEGEVAILCSAVELREARTFVGTTPMLESAAGSMTPRTMRYQTARLVRSMNEVRRFFGDGQLRIGRQAIAQVEAVMDKKRELAEPIG